MHCIESDNGPISTVAILMCTPSLMPLAYTVRDILARYHQSSVSHPINHSPHAPTCPSPLLVSRQPQAMAHCASIELTSPEMASHAATGLHCSQHAAPELRRRMTTSPILSNLTTTLNHRIPNYQSRCYTPASRTNALAAERALGCRF